MRATSLLRAAGTIPRTAAVGPSGPVAAPAGKSPLPKPLAGPLRAAASPPRSASSSGTTSGRVAVLKGATPPVRAGRSAARARDEVRDLEQPEVRPAMDRTRTAPTGTAKSLWQSYMDITPPQRMILAGVLSVFAGIVFLSDYLVPEEEEEAVETVFERKAREKLGTPASGPVGQIERRPS